MASPLALFENARILWEAPGARTGGREGFAVSTGDPYLISCFLKRRATPTMLTDRLSLPAINGAPLEFAGYCVRFVVLDPNQYPDWKTIDFGSISTWDETALLPAGLKRDAQVKMFMPGLGDIEARFSDKGASYGFEGIGAITRAILGDKIYLEGGSIG